MNKTRLGLGLVLLTVFFLVACKPTPEPEAPEEPPPPAEEEVEVEEAERPQPELAEPEEPSLEEPGVAMAEPAPRGLAEEERDLEPSYEGEALKPEELAVAKPTRGLNPDQLPAPRAARSVAPDSFRDLENEPDTGVIDDAARRYAEELARVEAPPRPEEEAPEFGVVYFDFDRYNIKPEFEEIIQENADRLQGNPGEQVIVEGHCDERGTTEYNLALGQRRANAVRDALVQAGVNPDRLETVSYGEERPVAMGHNEEAWSLNRRSVLTIE